MHTVLYLFYTFFFFQAEDGIRDLTVTGVQTCALPICQHEPTPARRLLTSGPDGGCTAVREGSVRLAGSVWDRPDRRGTPSVGRSLRHLPRVPRPTVESGLYQGGEGRCRQSGGG